jgi:hypothetical protein
MGDQRLLISEGVGDVEFSSQRIGRFLPSACNSFDAEPIEIWSTGIWPYFAQPPAPMMPTPIVSSLMVRPHTCYFSRCKRGDEQA